MASNSYPLWISQSLLLEEDHRGTILWMFLPSCYLTNHHSNSSEKHSLTRQWPKFGHPACGFKVRHPLWQSIGKDHCKMVYLRSWRMQGSGDIFKEKLRIRWLSDKHWFCFSTSNHKPWFNIQGRGCSWVWQHGQAGHWGRRQKKWKLPPMRCKKMMESLMQSRWRHWRISIPDIKW